MKHYHPHPHRPRFIAIREDNEAAELTGIDVTAYKIKAFVLSAVYCGVAGCLYAMMIKYVSPDTFVSNTSSVILWTAIVGGFGTVIGPVLGGIIMQVLPEALRFLGDWRLVVYGVIFAGRHSALPRRPVSLHQAFYRQP